MCVDQGTITQLKELMGEDFNLLVQTFVNDSSTKIEVMNNAVESGDAELLRTSAHGLKGSALNLSAAKLTELCMQLEDMGKANQLSGAKELLVAVEAEYHAVTGYLVST